MNMQTPVVREIVRNGRTVRTRRSLNMAAHKLPPANAKGKSRQYGNAKA